MNEQLNLKRAKRAADLISTKYNDNFPDTFSDLVDLVTDLRHWCHQNGMSWHEVSITALAHFNEEIRS